VILTRGSSTDHTYSEVHYRFAKKGGGDVQMSFLERASTAPRVKSMAIVYDPSVEGQITRSEGSRWDRASQRESPALRRARHGRRGPAPMLRRCRAARPRAAEGTSSSTPTNGVSLGLSPCCLRLWMRFSSHARTFLPVLCAWPMLPCLAVPSLVSVDERRHGTSMPR
jgi:hypothetical protein